MDRTIVAKEELQDWMTARIRTEEGCEECRFGGLMPLQDPDETGCNWSERVTLRATDVPPVIREQAFAKIMTEARSKFNIR